MIKINKKYIKINIKGNNNVINKKLGNYVHV